ncbi:hypothetical protein CIRG_02348 [Coccidioides immitis RMSCC 2394]|uniref:Uncharacterized protein n=1 Tax=Coccidioides immitis RMSCC 2394 TaxID=404692 RepID=A0A0J6Y205_COCIT|nr:hypothetical protein CIRG_02348 [Coccidioides immitis RMSCC 2394]
MACLILWPANRGFPKYNWIEGAKNHHHDGLASVEWVDVTDTCAILCSRAQLTLDLVEILLKAGSFGSSAMRFSQTWFGFPPATSPTSSVHKLHNSSAPRGDNKMRPKP